MPDPEKDKLIADLQRRIDDLESARATDVPTIKIEGFDGIKALDAAIQRRELGPFLNHVDMPMTPTRIAIFLFLFFIGPILMLIAKVILRD